jgi:hypothetical protein
MLTSDLPPPRKHVQRSPHDQRPAAAQRIRRPELLLLVRLVIAAAHDQEVLHGEVDGEAPAGIDGSTVELVRPVEDFLGFQRDPVEAVGEDGAGLVVGL